VAGEELPREIVGVDVHRGLPEEALGPDPARPGVPAALDLVEDDLVPAGPRRICKTLSASII